MSDLVRKGAVLATSAALALSGAAVPAVAKPHSNKGHHKTWSAAKCDKHAAHWKKSHKHPSAKQTNKENKFLAKHGCTNTV